MSQGTKRLKTLFIATAKGPKPPAKRPKYYADGGGLYLCVKASGARSWAFIFQWEGKRRELGLGSAAEGAVGAADARTAAEAAALQLKEGINPITAKRAPAPAEPVEPTAPPTFGDVATELITDLTPGWKHQKSKLQWTNSLKTHAPAIWAMPVRDVTTDHVLTALRPIWSEHQPSAKKVRERLERVLQAAKARGLRAGENPAAWRGHLDGLLPKKTKKAGSFPAMPFAEVPAFLVLLRQRSGVASRALEFTILTCARTCETIGARWSEIDRKAMVWTVPAERMKLGEEHRVPLCRRAVDILDALGQEYGREGFIFPSYGKSGHLSTGGMDGVLERMKFDHFTVHGFRSSFRTWAGETTTLPRGLLNVRELAEMSLSHVVGDTTERAYNRGKAFDRRRKLIDAWAGFCERPALRRVA